MNVKRIKKWDSLAETWHDAGPPASPSPDDLKIYTRFLRRAVKNVDSPKIMILGSTPRLRTLVARLEVPVTCVDISKRMLTKTSRLVTHKNTRERLVCQDWLHLDLPGPKFCAIVGDKILDNVPYERWLLLKERLIAHLRNGACFITRVAPQDRSLCESSFDGLLKKWAGQYDDGVLSLQKAASGLWEQTLGASAQTIPGKQSISIFNEEIKYLEQIKERLRPSEAALISEFTKLFGKSLRYEWTAYTLGNVIDALAEELTLVNMDRARDYAAARRQPILMFKYSG